MAEKTVKAEKAIQYLTLEATGSNIDLPPIKAPQNENDGAYMGITFSIKFRIKQDTGQHVLDYTNFR